MSVPFWVQDSIFYQIFPDRFANGDKSNDPINMQKWGAKPTIWDYQGGDLRGLVDRFDYFLDLGINAIYLNPIFQSTSNHRYNISDYFSIDKRLGDLQDFKTFIDVAHSNGIRIILDGVFNHCGRGFFAFNDVMENNEHSAYRDWFHIKRLPVDAYSPGKSKDYESWWGYKSLPKFNTNNPKVRNFIFKVARYWIEMGADGWRLDVPNEIDDDTFWAEFRHVVKLANRDAYLLGEIWDGNPSWVGDHHFDGLINYPIRSALLELLKEKIDVKTFGQKIDENMALYSRSNLYAMYLPLGSHDTERIITELDGNLDKVKAAFTIQFAFPGAPAIYYGDEIALPGVGDPDCRRAFPWDKSEWNNELRSFVVDLIALRKRLPLLRRGNYSQVLADPSRSCFAFSRSLGNDNILIIINSSSVRRSLRLKVGNLWVDGRIVNNILGDDQYIVSGDELAISLEPWAAIWVR